MLFIKPYQQAAVKWVIIPEGSGGPGGFFCQFLPYHSPPRPKGQDLKLKGSHPPKQLRVF